MKRLWTTLALSACASAVLLFGLPSSVATAGGKPVRAPMPDAAVTFDLPAGQACTFEVTGVPVVNREFTTTFPAGPNGDVKVTVDGLLIERLTNVSTGKAIVLNVSGPAILVYHADGSISGTAYGPSLLHLSPTDVPPGPIFVVNYGRIVATITAGGQFIVQSRFGPEFNICRALS